MVPEWVDVLSGHNRQFGKMPFGSTTSIDLNGGEHSQIPGANTKVRWTFHRDRYLLIAETFLNRAVQSG